MFNILSKESNIFSIFFYIIILAGIITFNNILNFSILNIISSIIAFIGLAKGYSVFNKLNINHKIILPLFIYTFFIFCFFPKQMDIGLAISLLSNIIIIEILTSTDDTFRKKSYMLVGILVGLNFIFLPSIWPMGIFVLIHILGTSNKIRLNLFRFIFGLLLSATAYFSICYFLDFNSWNADYLPKISLSFNFENILIYLLLPTLSIVIYGVHQHFKFYNEKSLTSKFRYNFLALFTLFQLVIVCFYMNEQYEYLLLLAFPFSVIISRNLQYIEKFWHKEMVLLILFLSLSVFKFFGIISLLF